MDPDPHALDYSLGSRAGFPAVRMRRLRQNPGLARMVREHALSVCDLVQPLFVRHGHGERVPISAMPGQEQVTVDLLRDEARRIEDLGIPAIILFGIPEAKDAVGSDACSEDGIIARAVRQVKESCRDLVVITDVCFCEYTDHGHCGVLEERDGRVDVDNDATLERLGLQAQVHARAGADVLAPSGMMDGMVAAVRTALDAEGYSGKPIMSYAVKFASALYGPFREAAQATPQFGDRRGYQMDPANAAEALREAALDVTEGADILLVKPALPYLDVIWRVRQQCQLPVACYNVSGEYAMVKAAARQGWVDERRVVLEMLMGMKRAGASFILTYFAREVAAWLRSGAC